MTPEQQTPASVVEAVERYDAGLLGDGGGGNVDWWWDYIRAELDRAHDHYALQIERLSAEREVMRAEIERADEVLGRAGPFYAASIEGARKIIRAALTQGESAPVGDGCSEWVAKARQASDALLSARAALVSALPAAPTPAKGGERE